MFMKGNLPLNTHTLYLMQSILKEPYCLLYNVHIKFISNKKSWFFQLDSVSKVSGEAKIFCFTLFAGKQINASKLILSLNEVLMVY